MYNNIIAKHDPVRNDFKFQIKFPIRLRDTQPKWLYTSKHNTMTQCRFHVGTPPTTLAQH